MLRNKVVQLIKLVKDSFTNDVTAIQYTKEYGAFLEENESYTKNKYLGFGRSNRDSNINDSRYSHLRGTVLVYDFIGRIPDIENWILKVRTTPTAFGSGLDQNKFDYFKVYVQTPTPMIFNILELGLGERISKDVIEFE